MTSRGTGRLQVAVQSALGDTVPPPRRRRVRVGRSVLLLATLGLAVHILLPQITALESSLQILRHLRWWALCLAVVAQVLSYVGAGYLLHAIARLVGARVAILRGMLITLAASSLGLLGSGTMGFGAASYRWMRKSEVSAEGAMLAGWVPTALNSAAQLAAAVFGVSYLLLLHRLTPLLATAFLLILSILLAVAGALYLGTRNRSRTVRVLVRLAGRWAALRHRPLDASAARASADRMVGALERLGHGGWRGPARGSALDIGFDMLTLFLLFLAAGHPISPGTLLAGYGLPLLLGKLTLLPGGVGIVEGAMAAMYEGLGVPRGVAVVVILSYRILSFWLPTLLGIPLILYFQRAETRVSGTPGGP